MNSILYKILAFVPDKLFLQLKYRRHFNRWINFSHPATFNEKLQWLKIYDRKPEYAGMVDKYEVRQYIADIIGEQYLIPLLGVWNHFDDINFSTLPDQFVLKCTHDSGGLVICKDKSNFDITAARKKIEHSLNRNFYYVAREHPYKNIKPRIIAEKYMEASDTNELLDYKFMCFNGEHKCTFVCSDRRDGDLKVTFFDNYWNVLPFERHYPRSASPIACPGRYADMVNLAKKLSAGTSFLRVDFYEIEGKIYFGELTFYPGGGFEEFTPEEWDTTLGTWIKLPTDLHS